MLCPGNEKLLIPGLNRLGVLNNKGDESICYSWTIHRVLKDIACSTDYRPTEHGYSLNLDFKKWAKRKGMPTARVDQLKLAAAMLTVWPELDITLSARQKRSANIKFFEETLLEFKQECDDYTTNKQSLLAVVQQQKDKPQQDFFKGIKDITTGWKYNSGLEFRHINYVDPIVCEADRMQKDPNSSVPLRQLTALFDAMNNAMTNPSSESATRCLNAAQDITKYSRAKMLGGLVLGFVGAIIVAASLMFALGSFGLFCPISVAGVYGGFYLMNSAVAIVGACAGYSCLKSGVSFFNKGRSAKDLMNKVEQFSGTITSLEVPDDVASANSSEEDESHFDPYWDDGIKWSGT